VANHIVDEARLNRHRFKSEEELRLTNQLDLTIIESDTEFLELYLF
jgi:hypothetical protein